MNDIMEFLTSDEMIIVGVIAGVGLLITLGVFIAEKTCHMRKVKQNTKELKNLALEVKEEVKKQEEKVVPAEVVVEKPLVVPVEEVEKTPDIQIIEKDVNVEEAQKEEKEVLEYTDIEPNEEEAKEELRKATENLLKQAELEKQEEEIVEDEEEDFEISQERDAVISIDELMQKSGKYGDVDDISLYEDEGDEPISISDLESRMASYIEEIEKIDEEEKIESEPVLIPIVEDKKEDNNVVVEELKPYNDTGIFKSSPIISPIFGIEDSNLNNDMEFENTANYEKFDNEMRKTNEFIVTLKELQKNLD